MKFLLALILGGAWTFYVALLIDRPDLAKSVVPPWDTVAHVAFLVLLIRTVIGLSWDEIKNTRRWYVHGWGILIRNLVVTLLGTALLLFTCRAVLYGIDQTQKRALW